MPANFNISQIQNKTILKPITEITATSLKNHKIFFQINVLRPSLLQIPISHSPYNWFKPKTPENINISQLQENIF